MKLTSESLKRIIREALSEMASGDDYDERAHIDRKRMDRMRRGEPDPRRFPGDPSQGTYVDTPGVEQGIVDDLKKSFGPEGEDAARAIIDAVKQMKKDGLI